MKSYSMIIKAKNERDDYLIRRSEEYEKLE